MNAFLVESKCKEFFMHALFHDKNPPRMPSVKQSIINKCTGKPTCIYSLNGNGTQQIQ